ncbi:MAG TPA: inorganic diphosphatase [Terriglobales bacterium]|nr:inorganic diphosphatase [Terriglobales bacterium]
MTDYLRLPIGDQHPELVNAVIEIPLGESNKYEYDKELQVFRLDRQLYSPVHYLGDYGFIPSTLAADGDPLDVLVLVDIPSFCGCVIEVRPIGLLEMLDQGVNDEKVLAIPRHNPRYEEVHNYTQIYPHVMREVSHFFSIYKDLEGKRTQMQGWRDAPVARNVIVECSKRFREQKKPAEPKPMLAKRVRH